MRKLVSFVCASSLVAGMAQAQSVATLWETNCANCHGAAGEGGGAGTKTLLTDDLRKREYDRPFFDAIKNGVADSGMSAFGETLSGPQMWGLVNHIRELQERAYRKAGGGAKKNKEGVYSSAHAQYVVEDVVDDLTTPWSVDFLPDGTMLITEREGTLRTFKDGKLSKAIKGTPKSQEMGQGGLMDVSPHPDFAKNGLVYLAFNEPIDSHPEREEGNRGAMTAIARGTIQDGEWTTMQIVWRAKAAHYSRAGVHFGCRIVWGGVVDGKREMYFAIGERGAAELSQDLTRPNGKIYRIFDDGSVPSDNPFVNVEGAYKSIWSYGHRNPQGLTFDLQGNLWDTEHGPRGGDELNLIGKGNNYGWPIVSFGINYNGSPLVVPWADVAGDKAAGKTFTMPTDLWLPSVGVCGLDVVTGSEFAGWKGDLVAGGLSGQSLDRFRIGKNAKGEFVVAEREELLKNVGRVRDVKTGPDGSIFVVLNGPDKVVRLRNSKEKARAIAPFEGKAKDASLEVKEPEVKKP